MDFKPLFHFHCTLARAIARAIARTHTDKKLNKIFLICKAILMGLGTKSYMRKGFLIYEEMRKYFIIYEEAVSHTWLCTRSLMHFIIYEENFIFFFYQCMEEKIAENKNHSRYIASHTVYLHAYMCVAWRILKNPGPCVAEGKVDCMGKKWIKKTIMVVAGCCIFGSTLPHPPASQ